MLSGMGRLRLFLRALVRLTRCRQSVWFAGGLWVAVTLAGCASASTRPDDRPGDDRGSYGGGLKKQLVSAGTFDLCTYGRVTKLGDPLTVYIEGDGLAWKSRNRLSHDPTPIHPTALRLAALDPSSNVVYVARPGQFIRGENRRKVNPEYWSSRRFSDEVIDSTNSAIDQWAEKARAGQIHLVGYSGGGAVAALAASRRTDVATLRTVAGNLNPEAVNRLHRVSPLSGSLNPMDSARDLSSIPQRHFVGTEDRVVPRGIAESFREASESSDCVHVTSVEGVSHSSGWEAKWPRLSAWVVECGQSDRT